MCSLQGRQPGGNITSGSVSPADAPKGDDSGGKHTSAAAPLIYRIVGNHELLSEHVGEQVEVTGMLEEQTAVKGTSADRTPGTQASVPVVHLESGKTLAPVCGPGV